MDKFNRLRSPKSWDWKRLGFKPDLQLQLAFEAKCQKTTNQKFVFTDKYVTQVLQNIANGNKGVLHDKMINKACHPPNFATFLQPIGPCLI